MAFNWGVGDIAAIAKLSWVLYHDCFLVAKGAPDDYREMVNELCSLQGILRTLRDDASSDNGYLQRLDESRKNMLDRCLQSSFETLKGLEKITVRYRQLGLSDGPQFWTRIKWSIKQKQISSLKNKIMVNTCNLSLCMSSIGNSSLARLETSMFRALERQGASNATRPSQDLEAEDDEDGLAPLRKTSTDTPTVGGTSGIELQGLQRQFTETTLVDTSPQMSPPTDDDEPPDFASPQPARRGAPAPGRMRKGSNSAALDTPPSNGLPPPSPCGSFDDSTENEPSYHEQSKKLPQRMMSNSLNSARDPKSSGSADLFPDLPTIMAEVHDELKRVREKEKSARPLRIVRRHPAHLPDEALKERFQQSADDELKIRRLNTRDWLRVATWWLLKARFYTRTEEDPRQSNPGASFTISSDGSSAINQAYVDLLKASWVIYDLILKDEGHVSSLLTDENRKLFHILSDGISEDLHDFQSVDAPERNSLIKQNYNIWELLQPAEEAYEDEGTFPGLENDRWITVEQEDAGADDETVLYRTFVDASLGHRRVRMKSKGAPYMLLLSIKEGESELKVTLCNQSGTLCLIRDLTIEDFQGKDVPTTPLVGMNAGFQEAFPLNFDGMNVTLIFTNQKDLQNFMYIPKAYFEAVRKREPRHLDRGTESLIFNRSVELVEHLKAPTGMPLSPRQISRSCDLRVLETTSQVGWRTTRRLVVSSSAGESPPWCMDSFLPLTRVQIRREGNTPTLKVKWSDCSQKKVFSDGNWNNMYSYVYDDTNPNNALSLVFRNAQDATDFELSVLRLTLQPLLGWTSGTSSGFTYLISDADPDPKMYKAILLIHSRSDWKYAELYYLYRDVDFIYDSTDRSAIGMRFPQVYSTNYLSSHIDRLYKADRGEAVPHFSHCEKKLAHVNVDCSEESTAMEFLSTLTSKHTLIFSRRCHYITTKPPSRFGGTKSSKGTAEVQLWLKGSTVRLISRWDGKVDDRWQSMTLPRDGIDNRPDSNRASFSKLAYERGAKMDLANLVARSPKDKKEDAKKSGPLTIAFESVKDREEFAAALEGSAPPPMRSASGAPQNLMDLI